MVKFDKANATPLDLTIISSILDCQTNNIKFKNITFDANTITDSVGTVFERQKTGKWLPDNNNYIYEKYVCSQCKVSFKTDNCMGKPLWKFCPNCGAKMEGTE